MSHPSKETKTASTLPDEITNLIYKARESVLGEILIEPFVARVLDTIVRAVKQNDSYTPSIAAIQMSIQDVEKLQTILRDMLRQIEALEVGRERRERFGERWWEQKCNELHDAFKKDPQEGLAEWLKTYAEALIAWELDICDKLANEPFPFPPQATDLSSLFQTGTQGIRDERYLEALDMLTYLTQADLSNQSQPILDQTSRAILFTLMGRISLYKSTDRERALKRFEQVKKLAPNDGWPYAALGDYYRAENDSHQALRLYQQAIERSPDQPDGYIGMGLLSEDQKRWDEADEWYERAIETLRGEKNIEAGLSRLLVPSGNIYLYIARMFEKEDPERALQAVIHAINKGIKGDGDYPERIGYRLKGEILETLKRPIESAESYYEAGRRFGWRNENQDAVDLLTQANKLNPDHQPTYWYLSDSLRMRSYPQNPPYVEEISIKESLKVWEEGVKKGLPDANYSWTYINRALINEQLARLPNTNRRELFWEAVVYLERAILFSEWDAYSWAYLGRYHSKLRNESNTLHATGKAVDYAPENPTALEERASILANVGDFDPAVQVIEKRLGQDPTNVWAKSVKAYILLHLGQYNEAIKRLNDVIEASPNDTWCIFLRALCYEMLNQPQEAEKDYGLVWDKRDPSNMDNDIGWAAYKLGKIDEAKGIFSRLTEDPLQAGTAYRSLGICHLDEGNLAQGEGELNKGIGLAINVRELDSLVNMDLTGIEKSSANRPDGTEIQKTLDRIKERIRARRTELERRPSAREELERVVAKLKSKVETDSWAWIGAHAGLARLYAEKKRWNDAITIYKLLREDSKRFPEAHIGLENIVDKLQEEANRLLKEGKTAEAVELFQQALQFESELSRPDKLAMLQQHLGDAMLKEGKPVEAIQCYKNAIEKDPKTALYRIDLILAYKESGRFDEAEKAYQEAIEFDPDNPLYLNDLGNAFYGKGEYKKAAENYKKAINKDPGVAVYNSNLGLAYRYMEKWDESIEAYNQAVKLEPNNPNYLNYLGNAFYGKGEYERAAENYKKAIEKDPKVAVYHANLGLAFKDLGRWKDAEDKYLNAINLEPDNPENYNGLGNVFYASGDYQSAVEQYAKAIEKDKDQKVAVYHSNLGLAFGYLGKWDEAEKAYLKAVELEPNNPEYHDALGIVYSMLGLAYYRSGNYEEAIDCYKKAIEKNSQAAIYHANLGLAFRDLVKWEEAEKAYLKAIELEPDNAEHHNSLGIVYYRSGNIEKAVDCYKNAIEKDPKVAVYHANLGLAFKDLGRWKAAEDKYLNAINLEPDNPENYNGLGNVFYAKGDYEKAAESYQKAIEKNSQVAIYHSNLILVYTKLGKLVESGTAYKKAIEIDPNNAVYRDELGKAFYDNWDYDRSAEQYLEAIKINPEVQVYTSNLILACEQFKDSDKAKSLLESALVYVKKNSELIQTIETFKNKLHSSTS